MARAQWRKISAIVDGGFITNFGGGHLPRVVPIALLRINNNLYFGGTHNTPHRSIPILSVSTDEGATWSASLVDPSFHALTVFINHNGRLLVGCADKLLISNDKGRTWSETGRGLDQAGHFSSMASKGDLLFAVKNSKIFISSDNGDSWSDISQGIPLTQTNLGSVFTVAVSGNNIIVGRQPNPEGSTSMLYLTEDNGANWRSSGLPTRNSRIYSLVADRGYVYASGKSQPSSDTPGILVSKDSGRSWALKAALGNAHTLFATSNLLFALVGAMYVSEDFGESWINISEGFPEKISGGVNAFLGTDGNNVYFSNGELGIYAFTLNQLNN